jgi:glycosyltransferase involved in cell wall biosynthesis
MYEAATSNDDRLPTVALGMPVYNGERFIGEAIRSILDQSFGDFELVICDNASTDATEQICRKFVAEDSRVRYFRNPANLGAHPNFNLAFSRARGKYFKWAAHDDTLHPDYLRECVAGIETQPGAVQCQSDLEFIDESSQTIGVVPWTLEGASSDDPVRRFGTMVLRSHNCYDIMGLFRRCVLAGVSLMNFHGADRTLLVKMASTGPFAHVHRPLIRVRDFPGRYTRAQTRPSDRAKWHDTRITGRITFPHWRLYGTYWDVVREMDCGVFDKLRAAAILVAWWFVDWNFAKMAVDLIAVVAPDAIGFAERFKRRYISPAPGIDEVRRKTT